LSRPDRSSCNRALGAVRERGHDGEPRAVGALRRVRELEDEVSCYRRHMVRATACRTATFVVAGLLASSCRGRSVGTAAAKRDPLADAECAFTPCCGTVVGNWKIRRACPTSLPVAKCPAASLEPKNVNISGTFAFGADGMLTFDITSTGTWDGVVPAQCVPNADCAAVAKTMYQPNAPAATCTADGHGGCKCSSPATPLQTGTMPYRVTDSTAAGMWFCAKDGSLKLRNESGTVFVAGP